MARYAKVDNGKVSDLFDGQKLSDLQATYPNSVFQEADPSIQRDWTWDGSKFENPNAPIEQERPIPTNAEIELLIRAERDRLEDEHTADLGPKFNAILFGRVSTELDNRKGITPEIPVLRGIAKANTKKNNPSDADINASNQTVIARLESLGEYSQKLTIAYRTLVAQIPTLTDDERRNYDAVARFAGVMA